MKKLLIVLTLAIISVSCSNEIDQANTADYDLEQAKESQLNDNVAQERLAADNGKWFTLWKDSQSKKFYMYITFKKQEGLSYPQLVYTASCTNGWASTWS